MQLKYALGAITIALFLASMVLVIKNGVDALSQLLQAGGFLGLGWLNYLRHGKSWMLWFFGSVALFMVMTVFLSGQ
ncbi:MULTISPECIES: hypothetical protein [Chitinilyticum]|uniref:Uncharacterized protein n=1 Tax=Chitinilyticum piscinae TaxID=2866724 RepID=A0A8J7K7H8_9NEIS|nr:MULTISPECIES: hypothetical protein [Chitinilyticum]MBE9608083.1 hypothetical protein [Chitinilyticum piscinae]